MAWESRQPPPLPGITTPNQILKAAELGRDKQRRMQPGDKRGWK